MVDVLSCMIGVLERCIGVFSGGVRNMCWLVVIVVGLVSIVVLCCEVLFWNVVVCLVPVVGVRFSLEFGLRKICVCMDFGVGQFV